jgi:hypothetical protein
MRTLNSLMRALTALLRTCGRTSCLKSTNAHKQTRAHTHAHTHTHTIPDEGAASKDKVVHNDAVQALGIAVLDPYHCGVALLHPV